MTEKTILYVEDNFHNRRIVRKILERQGYTIYEEEDGIKGFNKLQELVPPVVLLDISLPGMDGIEIAKNVKADDELKHIILIALTASAMQGDRERFLAAGCDDYLSKPFRAVGLVEMVNHHFDNLPEQPVKIEPLKEEWPPFVSEEQDDGMVEFAVPDLKNIGSTKSLGELPTFGESLVEEKSVEAVPLLDLTLDEEDQTTPVSKKIAELEADQEEHTEPAIPVDMSLDEEDQATPVSKEIAEQESKQEELIEPVTSVEVSLEVEDQTATVSKEIEEQEPKQEEFTEPATSVEGSLDVEDQTPLDSKEIEEQEPKQEEFTEPVTSVEVSLDVEDQTTLDSKEIEEQEPKQEELTEPVAPVEAKTSAEGDTQPLNELEVIAHEYLEKEEGVPTVEILAQPNELEVKPAEIKKAEKAKPKAKSKTKGKAKTKTTKAKLKAKPKTKAKAKTKAAKTKAQSKKKQAEKAAPVLTSLKADDRTRPLWEPFNPESEIVPASESIKPSPPSKAERKANETEGAPIEEITDTIVGMINSKTIKPVDPNGNMKGE